MCKAEVKVSVFRLTEGEKKVTVNEAWKDRQDPGKVSWKGESCFSTDYSLGVTSVACAAAAKLDARRAPSAPSGFLFSF